jgi:hypothetical protein
MRVNKGLMKWIVALYVDIRIQNPALTCFSQQDDMKFMRIWTKRHEIMISPGKFIRTYVMLFILTYFFTDERWLLVVLQDPTSI